MFQYNYESRKKKKKQLMSHFEGNQAREIAICQGSISLSVVFRPSTGLWSPIHIREDNLLELVYLFKY